MDYDNKYDTTFVKSESEYMEGDYVKCEDCEKVHCMCYEDSIEN